MTKKPASKFRLEALESRLLFSAEAVAPPPEAADPGSGIESVLESPLVPEAGEAQGSESNEKLRRELVFIDAGVSDYQQLLEDILEQQDAGRKIEALLLDSERNGVDQISEYLRHQQGISAIHLVSHGSDGSVTLGSTSLTLATLDAYAETIESWQDALTEQADLLLYGCDLAQGQSGVGLIESLSLLTGADVAASDDLTGHALLGGDWILEVNKGQIEADIALSLKAQQSWLGTLTNPDFVDMDVPLTLTPMAVNTPDPTGLGAVGDLVSDIVDLIENAGGHDNVTDPDAAAQTGIAITQVNDPEGRLWWSTDNGANWNLIPASGPGQVGPNTALLLAADANTRVYYQANAGFTGYISNAFNFRAWDQTAGTNGSYGDTTNPPAPFDGTFSSGQKNIALQVTTDGSNAAPTADNINANETYSVDTPLNLIDIVVYDDFADNKVGVTLTMSDPAAGSLSTPTHGSGQNATTSTFINGVWNVVGELTAVNNILSNVTYTPSGGYSSAFTVDVSISDGIATPITGIKVFSTGAANNVPVATANTVTTDEGVAYSFKVADFTYTDVEGDALLSATITNQSLAGGTLTHSGGTTVNNGDTLSAAQLATLVYTPASNANGSPLATFDFTVNDLGLGIVSAQMDIDVTPVNTPPVAVPDSYTVNEGSTTNLNLAANDSDADDGLNLSSITIVSGPTNGTIDAINADGTVDYTHDGSETLSDSFTYTIDDLATATSNTVTVNLTITPQNDAPVAAADSFTVNEGSTNTLNLAGNDSDADDGLDLSSITIISGPSNGTIDAINADGTVDYTHDGSETLSDSFTYTIDDLATATSNTVTVNLTITPQNDAPVAAADSFTVNEGSTTNLNLAANDSDADDGLDLSSITIISGPTNGTIDAINADGTVDYTHDGSETLADSVTYTIDDLATATSNTVTVSLTITPQNDAPVAVADSFTVNEGSTNTLNLASNDSDADDGLDLTSITIISGPTNGTIDSINADGTVDYTHDGTETLSDSFTYTIDDLATATSNTVTVSLTITPQNDAPIATADSFTVNEGSTNNLNLASNDSDADDGLDLTSITIVSGLTNGTIDSINADGTVDYTHDGSETLSDSFTYTIDDLATATSNTVTVSLTITPQNDAPVATADSFTVNEGSTNNLNLASNDTDADDGLDLSSITIITGPTNGTIDSINADGTVDYTHDGSETLSDSFTYTIKDASGTTSNTVTVNLTVTPQNDAPVATADSFSVNEGSTTNLNLASNDSDADDGLDLASITIISGPTNGTIDSINADGTVDYTHDGSETLSDSFTYTIDDLTGATSNTVTVSLTITPQNDAPVATADSFSVNEGSSTNLNLAGNDSDADDGLDLTSITIISGPTNGTIDSINADGTVDYTHDGSETVADSFTYTIDDLAGATTSTVTVSLTVTPQNDVPVAVADSFTVNEGSTTNLNLAANDSDADDGLDLTSITIISGPTNGTIDSINADGTVDYTHDGSETLSDSFTYTIDDLTGATSNTVTVSLTITPQNDAPVATADSFSVNEGSTTNLNLAGNDSDADDGLDLSSITIVSGPTNGTIDVIKADGTVDYTHDGSETVSDSFTYTIDDLAGVTSNTVTVSITIAPLNDNNPVFTSNPTPVIPENTKVVLTVEATDADLPTQTILYTVTGGADAAKFTIDGSNQLVFLQAPDFEDPTDADANNIYEVEVTADDQNGRTTVQSISVTVTNVVNEVFGIDDAYTLDEDSTLNSNDTWFDANWSFRRTLSFNNSAQAQTLVDFPVLIKLDSSRIDYSNTQNNGEDLCFVDSGGSVLSHEIESWNEAGTSYVWVKIPQINGASDTDFIWMYYGNSSASDGQDSANVWSGDYKAVLHLNETAGIHRDSTSNNNDASQVGGVNKSAIGKSGGADDFDGIDDYLWVNGAGSALRITGDVTLEAWIWMDSFPGDSTFDTGTDAAIIEFAGFGDASSADNYLYAMTATFNGDINLGHESGVGNNNFQDMGVTLNTAQWYHLTAVRNTTTKEWNLFVNGVQAGSTFSYAQNTTGGSNGDLYIGWDHTNFDGIIDEIRVSATARSAEWIAAQHASEADTFVTYGYEQTSAGVLGNDIDPTEDPLTATVVTGPSNAAAFSFNSDGSFTYTPVANFSGTDSFTYKANDGTADSNLTTVTITVNPLPDTPTIGGVDTGSVTEDVDPDSNTLLETSGSLTISDPDSGESLFVDETIAGSYGSLTIDAAGAWSYSADNTQAAIQQLGAADSLTENITVTTADGTTQNIVITINGANDTPLIGGIDTGSVTEDVDPDADTLLETSGALTISDTDTGQNQFVAETIPGTYGILTIDAAGNWDFTADNTLAAIQQLGAADSLTEAITVTTADGTTHNIVITINGADDAPLIGGVDTGSVTEDIDPDSDNLLETGNALTISDTDAGQSQFIAETIAGTYGSLTIDAAGNWTYEADNNQVAIQALGAGDNLADSFTVTTADGTSHNIVITINGADDAPVIGGVDTGSVTEDVDPDSDTLLETSDTLTISDTDTGQNQFVAETIAGTYGSLTIDAAGNWDYSANNLQVAIQELGATDSLTDTLTVTTADGSTHNIVITINGADDAPVIGGVDTGSVTEDIDPDSDNLLETGNALTISDTDTGQSQFVAETIAGTYGSLTIDAAGNWTYGADNTQVAIQQLGAGDSLTDTITVTTADGTTHNIVITLNGANDAPVIGGVDTASVTEDVDPDADMLLETAGPLTISDTDAGQNQFVAESIAGTYGSLTIDATGNWAYGADNTQVAIQQLGAGDSLTDTITVTTADGTTHDIVITINGANNAPVLGGVDTGNVTEDVDPDSDTLLETGNALTISDTDAGQSQFVAETIAGTYGSLTIDAAGNWSYEADNTQAAIQELGATDSLTDTLTVTTADGTTHNIVITINGANDAPTIGGVDTGSVTEDVDPDSDNLLETSSALTISDTDAGQSQFVAETIAGTYGSLTIDAAGSWSYSADNTQAAIQQLRTGDSLTDTITVTTADGTTHNIVITINGADDAPIMGGVDTGSVTEEVDPDSDNLLETGNALTISDTDAGQSQFVAETIAGTYGSLTIDAAGNWSYEADNTQAPIQQLGVDDSLNDSFSITTADGTTHEIQITIHGANDGQILTDDNFSAVEDSALTITSVTDLLSNDSDIDGDVLTLSSFTQPAHGSLVDNGDGTLTYTPGENFNGHDSFTYSVSDGQGDIATGTAIIVVSPVADTPQVTNVATLAGLQSGLIYISPNQHDGAEVTHFKISGITGGTLYLADGVTQVNNGYFITLAQAQAGLRFTPSSGSSADGHFDIQASLDGTSVSANGAVATATIKVSTPTEKEQTPAEENTKTEEEKVQEQAVKDEVAPEKSEPLPKAVEEAAAADPPVETPKESQAQNSTPSRIPRPLLVDSNTYTFEQSDALGQEITQTEETASSFVLKLQNAWEALDIGALSAETYEHVRDSFDEFRTEVAEDMRLDKAVVGSAIVTSMGLSAGYVVWMLKGGSLLASVLSSMPAWQLTDPLSILASTRGKEEDEESLESIIDEGSKKKNAQKDGDSKEGSD